MSRDTHAPCAVHHARVAPHVTPVRTMTSMRALALPGPGEPSSVVLTHLPDPVPAAGEVRIAVRACGLNPVDVQTMRRGNPAWQHPHVLGLDVAGTVDAVGDDVDELRVGDKVAFHGDLRRPGGLAEVGVTDAACVAKIPAGLTFAEAAALPCAGMTAYQAVHRRLHVRPKDVVLVSAGAGGVGGFAVQLAHLAGATVIAVASAANHDYLATLGADRCLDYAGDEVVAKVRDLTEGRGVDGIVDAVSGQNASSLVPLLAHGGGVVSIAGRASADAVEPFTTAPSVHEIALGAAHSHGDVRARHDLARMLDDMMSMVDAGVLDPTVTETVAWDDVPAAWDRLAGRHVRGKIVALTPGA